MSDKNNKNWLHTLIIVVVLGLSFAISGTLIVKHANERIATENANKRVKMQNATIQKANNKILASSFANKATNVLTKGLVGTYAGSNAMWDSLHNQTYLMGIDSLQGSDKTYFMSTYYNGASSNIKDVTVSQFGDSFTISFDYNYATQTTGGSTMTQTLEYSLYGHKVTDSSWQVDKIVKGRVN